MPLYNNLRVQQHSGGSLWLNDLFQYMPERRIRVNPEGIPDLACWLIAVSQEWEGILRRTHAGLNVTQRAALRGQKQFARHCLTAVGLIIRRMAESVPAKDFEKACDLWRSGLVDPETDAEKRQMVALAGALTQQGG